MPQLGQQIGETAHHFSACLAAIAAHFGESGHEQDDLEATRPAAGNRDQRAHFMDIGLPRAAAPLGFPLDTPDPLEFTRMLRDTAGHRPLATQRGDWT